MAERVFICVDREEGGDVFHLEFVVGPSYWGVYGTLNELEAIAKDALKAVRDEKRMRREWAKERAHE